MQGENGSVIVPHRRYGHLAAFEQLRQRFRAWCNDKRTEFMQLGPGRGEVIFTASGEFGSHHYHPEAEIAGWSRHAQLTPVLGLP